MVRLMRILVLMAVELVCTVSAFTFAPLSIVRQPHLSSARRSFVSATKISDWDRDVSEPPGFGRSYGSNWSLDEALKPKEVPQKAGALVWAIGNETYVHPELRPDLPVGKWLNSRPNLGICMSGGGMRAATCTLGWYRALHHLKILQNARFLGANSGSTWTTLPLFARQLLEKKDRNVDIDFDEYLGKYVQPDQLVHVDLADVHQLGKIGNVLEKSNILDFQKDAEVRPSFNDWCNAIDENYVAPIVSWKGQNWQNDFWLDLSNAYLWNTEAAKEILNSSTLPFPIFVSTCYESNNIEEFLPVENTFLYSGIPVDPRLLTNNDFGGGFVQGVALNSEGLEDSSPVAVNPTEQYVKEFKLPNPVVKISELTGASSNFGAAGDAQTKVNLQKGLGKMFLNVGYFLGKWFGPMKEILRDNNLKGYLDPGKYKFWSPSSGGDVVDLEFVDGGMYDNLGVLALLRRGCSTIIACNAADGNLTSDEMTETKWSSSYYDVAALFGEFEPYMPAWVLKEGYKNTVNSRSKVFANEEFGILMKEMTDLQKHGKPLVVRKKLQLIPNELAGIYDKREVNMIFCFNGEVKEFEVNFEKKLSGLADNFPYVDTMECDYSIETVNKLSLLSCYNLAEGLKNLDFDINEIERTDRLLRQAA
jgi:hypothetical protein